MRLQCTVAGVLLIGSSLWLQAFANPMVMSRTPEKVSKIAPKVFIVSMFEPETEIWWGIPEFDLLAHNITVPGLSPIYPDSEINAATTIMALTLSPLFDLRKTYFFIAGIAGVNPERATIGSVTFARFAVQVALQHEIDPRELPANYSTGYIPQGSYLPNQFPGNIYGTEVFEVNDDLRAIAVLFAQQAKLADSSAAQVYRAKYATPDGQKKIGALPPSVVKCDVATSDVYYSGNILSSGFDNITSVWTNGTGQYCSTAQEDNATLEALLRSSVRNLTDFSRIIVMRTASDFDRPHPGEEAVYHLLYANQGGFKPAVQNIYLAGVKVVEGILSGWNTTFAAGVTPSNYIGDMFGSLGGTPDFGPGRQLSLADAGVLRKRGLPKVRFA
ncbi:hypothetical protein MPDQ_005450 [Monascus purpureus]|uniref:Purine nucleoside permease n=1 Tax=Monascus purpureus TaxID=5098 RepID=A0A507QWP6_MONPU|nr:hypothetical protein MPDQ_005450 [Monascus purpureus]